MDRPIENCYWVEPGRLLAGEYPTVHDDLSSPAKVAALESAGIADFIDLTMEKDNLIPYSHMLSPASVHHRFPIQDGGIPESEEFTRTVLDTIDECIKETRMVYVHCWGGVGRTGLVVGCWLARHGFEGEAALKRLKELWLQCPKSRRNHNSETPETSEQERYILNWRE